MNKVHTFLVMALCSLMVIVLLLVVILRLRCTDVQACQVNQSEVTRSAEEQRRSLTRLSRNSTGKIGVIITTFGSNVVYAKQCVLCFLRHVKYPRYVLLYVNGSDDPRLLNIKSELPGEVEVVVSRTPAPGGLTWTWNDGIRKCLAQHCTTIVLSNDDVIFDHSISNILHASETANASNVYFGPVSNKPGNDTNHSQLAKRPKNKPVYKCTYKNRDHNLNGFFLVFPSMTLQHTMFDEDNFFNPKYPFGGNETEWFKRFQSRGGKGMVVPATFVYHYKLQLWRAPQDATACVYTINVGGYEGDRVLLNNKHNRYAPADVLYFTDNDKIIYTCLKLNVTPFLVFPDTGTQTSKLLQRTIKTSPHLFLPAFYKTSIYVDGNVELTGDTGELLQSVDTIDLVCFQHPRSHAACVHEELDVIVDKQLASPESVQKVKQEMQKLQFDPSQHLLTETNVLVRKHHNLHQFSEDWTRFIHMCPRDQASFDFLLWKHNVYFHRRPFSSKPARVFRHVNPVNRLVGPLQKKE